MNKFDPHPFPAIPKRCLCVYWLSSPNRIGDDRIAHLVCVHLTCLLYDFVWAGWGGNSGSSISSLSYIHLSI